MPVIRFRFRAAPVRSAVVGLTIAALGRPSQGAPAIGADRDRYPVTCESVGRSLTELLARLSRESGRRLMAAPDVGEQRVTGWGRALPLREVMTNLSGLLSHAPDRPVGYRWVHEPVRGADDDRWVLRRDRISRQVEAQELDYPRARAAAILRLLRSQARTPLALRKAPPADMPAGLLTNSLWALQIRALSSLTNAQFAAVIAGRPAPVDPGLFPAEAAAFARRRVELLEPGDRPFRPVLRLRWLDEDDASSRQAGSFILEFDTDIQSFGVGWNQYAQRNPPDYSWLPDTAIDLRPFLDAPHVTREQRGDVGFTLAGVILWYGRKSVDAEARGAIH